MQPTHIAPTNKAQAYIQEVLKDYRTCCISREMSLLGRKEVLRGKAKFGIFGDGKEVPQVALARAFRKGDYRSGYYRDQTFMLAAGLCTIEEFFAQLYADTENDPFSGGRQMNSHFATPFIDAEGNDVAQKNQKNVSSDISPTAGQMARAFGLAAASKYYRNNEAFADNPFSNNGNEVSFVTIGDASTSEGVFWETMNAASVLRVPLAVCVWDDGYGISVPKRFQTAKSSISVALSGFEKHEEAERGLEIYTSDGWDYPHLLKMFEIGVAKMRETHTPALFHIQNLTQPQGHSTSGSHERYKGAERLQWELDNDCIKRFGEWIIEVGIATQDELNIIQEEAKQLVAYKQKQSWAKFIEPIKKELDKMADILTLLAEEEKVPAVNAIKEELLRTVDPLRRDIIMAAKKAARATIGKSSVARAALLAWLEEAQALGRQRYQTNLHSETSFSAKKVSPVAAKYAENPPMEVGHKIINGFFDGIFEKDARILAFGEDVGQIGDVNQGFAGLQEKYGKKRVADTGIREWTIMGQGLGLAMRGLRPIAEIQYLDYLLYGLPLLSDDLATLTYRTNGIQRAPFIIRTRGHRLEGIWHTGSPIGMILHSLRGINVLVPRNFVQAVGFYNTLLKSDEPALVIECLNGYRHKEAVPENLADFTLPLGMPEILQEGTDITLVTYGSCVRVALEGIKYLAEQGISVELIDVQSLLPFDVSHIIGASLKKTNRLLVMDEDVPGGATGFMLQHILEVQNGYQYLDSAPRTLTAWAGRCPYGTEGDYFTKPNADNVFEVVYEIMHEANPAKYPY